MRPTGIRSGATLIELIMAVLLLLIVTSVGSLATRRSISTVAHVTTVESRSGSLSDALRTLARHVSNAEPREQDLHMVHDSVLDIVHTIGFSTVCRSRADTLFLSSTNDSVPWGAVLPRAVTDDDQLRVWDEVTHDWRRRGIRVVAAASGACGDSTTPRFGSAAQRLILDDSVSDIAPGAIVRVVQRERWSLVRGGDGQWSLSLATWNPVTANFSIPQPLVAPLAAPSAAGGSGFDVRAIDAAGVELPDSGLTRTRSIIAQLRSAAHTRFGAVTDSVRINVGPH